MLDNYNVILQEFEAIAYHQNSRLDQYQSCRALDRIYQKNLKDGKEGEIFNRDISQEIFEQTAKNQEEEVTLKDYIHTIIQAQNLLSKYIQEVKDKGQLDQDEQVQLNQYEEDYHLLTATFNIATPKPVEEDMVRSITSPIFAELPRESTDSETLKWVLAGTIGAVGLQLVLMFIKPHFIALLAYLAVGSIFLLNYFDRPHIYTCLALLATSATLDFLWVILQADHYWSGQAPSHHSTQQTGFMRFVYVMTLLSMLGKAAILYFLAPFRKNSPESCKTVRLFNLRFDLSAAAPSPVALFWHKADI